MSTNCRSVLLSILLLSAQLLVANAAYASRLFAVDIEFPQAGHSLFEIDPNTGETSPISGLEFRIWSGLSGRPGDGQHVYAVSRIPGSEFSNALSTIDIATGEVLDLFTWTASDFGLPSSRIMEFTGVDISASAPGLATISFFTFDSLVVGAGQSFLFDLDLDSGTWSAPRAISGESTLLRDLTSKMDGELFGIAGLPGNPDPINHLAKVDRDADAFSLVGTTAACGCEVIEFDPATGKLFGIDTVGHLRIVSKDSADEIAFIGATGLSHAGGLAFVVPEPSTSSFLGIGAAAIVLQRRRGRAAHSA